MSSSILGFLLILLISDVVQVSCQKDNPWLIDTTSCPPEDTPTVCKMKKKQCSPINNLLQPPSTGETDGSKGGLLGLITSCVNQTGTTLDPKFYMKMGLSYAQGKPELLIDNASADPISASALKICVLNSTGLIGSDKAFNKTAAMISISKQPLGPDLVLTTFTALVKCPEPKNYTIGPFISCVREACITKASATYPARFGFGGGSKIIKEANSFGGGQYGGGSKYAAGSTFKGEGQYGGISKYAAAPTSNGAGGQSGKGVNGEYAKKAAVGGVSPSVAKYLSSFYA